MPTTTETWYSLSQWVQEIVLANSKSRNHYYLLNIMNELSDLFWNRFALHNIKLTLAHLLWRFDLKLGKGIENWAVGQRIYNGWIQPALPVLMEKRAPDSTVTY